MGFSRKSNYRLKLRSGIDIKNVNNNELVGPGNVTIKVDTEALVFSDADVRKFFTDGYKKVRQK